MPQHKTCGGSGCLCHIMGRCWTEAGLEVSNKIGRIKQHVFDFYCYSAKTFLCAKPTTYHHREVEIILAERKMEGVKGWMRNSL